MSSQIMLVSKDMRWEIVVSNAQGNGCGDRIDLHKD